MTDISLKFLMKVLVKRCSTSFKYSLSEASRSIEQYMHYLVLGTGDTQPPTLHPADAGRQARPLQSGTRVAGGAATRSAPPPKKERKERKER